MSETQTVLHNSQEAGFDGTASGTLVASASQPGETLDPDQVLREHVEIHVLPHQLHIRNIRSVGQGVAMGYRPMLHRISPSGCDQRRVVVLHDIVRVLLVADHLAVLGRQAQGLLADVRPPHRHHSAALVQLGLQPAPDRDSDAARSRLRGHIC